MIIDNKYTISYTPMYSLMDAKGRVSPIAMMNITQDLAAAHYGSGGLSIPHLQEKGETWFITKQKFEFFEYPLGLDELVIQTWAHEPKGLFCIRDYRYSFAVDGKKPCLDKACADIIKEHSKNDLTVKQENIVMNASSAWMIIDQKTGRPLKATDFSMGNLTFCNEDAIEGGFLKITMSEDWDVETPFTPSLLDIDINDHVNNLSYSRWVLSFMDYDFCKDKLLKSIEINFVAQALFGDKLICKHKKIDENTFVHSITKEDGTETFRARTVWANENELARVQPVSN